MRQHLQSVNNINQYKKKYPEMKFTSALTIVLHHVTYLLECHLLV